jgi:cation transport ATPase
MRRAIDDGPVATIAVGDGPLARVGKVVPVGGIVDTDSAMIDGSALTGEPIPVSPAGPPSSAAH